jgi:hypothetical protein
MTNDYSAVLQERHSFRRRALRVPHAAQRIYIVRVNQLVMNALTPKIPIRTAAFKRKSFNLRDSPLFSDDTTARVHTRPEKVCQALYPGKQSFGIVTFLMRLTFRQQAQKGIDTNR